MTERLPRDLEHGRHAGVLVPLASIPSSRSWGIGELGDLEALGHWLHAAGLDLLQLLPINEMACVSYGRFPAISSYRITPRAYTSVRTSMSAGFPRACSGLM